jgi:hypothetical protein
MGEKYTRLFTNRLYQKFSPNSIEMLSDSGHVVDETTELTQTIQVAYSPTKHIRSGTFTETVHSYYENFKTPETLTDFNKYQNGDFFQVFPISHRNLTCPLAVSLDHDKTNCACLHGDRNPQLKPKE